jgi:hypothetical protein
MVALDVLVLFTIVLFVAFVVTQIAIPTKNGTRLFPLFLKDMKKLNNELVDANQEVQASVLADQIEATRKRARKPKQETF